MKTTHILLGGEAGQGLDTVASLLGKALVRAGWHLLIAQHVMSRVRGGHNNFRIRIADCPVHSSPDSFHLLAAMSRESVALHQDKLVAPALILTDAAWDIPTQPGILPVPYADLAARPVFRSVALLGILGHMLSVERGMLEDILSTHFAAKGADIVAANLDVLAKAIAWAAQATPQLAMPAPDTHAQRIALDGNQAIVLGALAAGVRFCGYYPMSPATSIAEGLVSAATDMHVVVEQAEDEIAAANMALGAAYGGARSIVPTSGGGFALMTEAVSLAGVMEMPVVFAVVQRPGPATGLATRTEQADLELVLHAGHGEFPRAILAPSSPEDCFALTPHAFNLAEKFQTPVFLLSDQFLASAIRSVEPFDVGSLPPLIEPDMSDDAPQSYLRYSLNEPISPRRVPGNGRSLVLVDSHEHNEAGHIIEDGETRVRMQDKRLAKHQLMCAEVLPPAYEGHEQPDLLLVAWGSTCGPVREVVSILCAEDIKAGCLCFTQVWPLAPASFLPRLTQARIVVDVEGNSTAQFAGLLRKTTGISIEHRILRYDGRAITSSYIAKHLRSLLEAL